MPFRTLELNHAMAETTMWMHPSSRRCRMPAKEQSLETTKRALYQSTFPCNFPNELFPLGDAPKHRRSQTACT